MAAARLASVGQHVAAPAAGARPPVTTHVLDSSRGRPAAGVPVALHAETAPGVWTLLGSG